jgi:hypothetical protein
MYAPGIPPVNRERAMKPIWAVTTGQYSDYEVVAVFASKELAEEYVRITVANTNRPSSTDLRVEDFTYYDELPEHHVVLLAAETIGAQPYPYREYTDVVWGAPKPFKADLWERPNYQAGFCIEVRVEGTDHQRVRKVFSEKLAQAKADPRING